MQLIKRYGVYYLHTHKGIKPNINNIVTKTRRFNIGPINRPTVKKKKKKYK